MERTVKERAAAAAMGALADGDRSWEQNGLAGRPWWGGTVLAFSPDHHGGVSAIDCFEPQSASPLYYFDRDDRDKAVTPRVASLGELLRWFTAILEDGAMGYDRARRRWKYDDEALPSELRQIKLY